MTSKSKPTLSLGSMPKPKPAAAVDEAAARKVIGEDTAPAPPMRGLVTEAPKRGRPPAPGGSKSSTWRRMTVYLPPDVAEELRVAAARQDVDISDLLAEGMRAWLAARGG